ncbi:hypothetical protein AC579_1622 [Pseudocercospora musae]|uniref:Uncharacterized protein n=1 Tax=Pseudocercospora musae TaxID=113226 RepID=A0A139H6M1_9PEZI|nr:hypothetical protein AC579_1622 [Pseudocercospora musae]
MLCSNCYSSVHTAKANAGQAYERSIMVPTVGYSTLASKVSTARAFESPIFEMESADVYGNMSAWSVLGDLFPVLLRTVGRNKKRTGIWRKLVRWQTQLTMFLTSLLKLLTTNSDTFGDQAITAEAQPSTADSPTSDTIDVGYSPTEQSDTGMENNMPAEQSELSADQVGIGDDKCDLDSGSRCEDIEIRRVCKRPPLHTNSSICCTYVAVVEPSVQEQFAILNNPV